MPVMMVRKARSSTSVTRTPGYAFRSEAVDLAALRHVVGERGKQVVSGAYGVGRRR